MKTVFEEKDIYCFEGVEESFDNDEISGEEQGFMLGYLSDGGVFS